MTSIARQQARRNLPASQSSSFQWHKSYNWFLLLLPMLLGVGYLWQMEQMMPIRSIELSGAFEHLDQKEVESTLEQYAGQGFFSLDIHHLQRTLGAKPWAESVSVRRIWPDRLQVTIIEKKPVARWDADHLLSDKASIFRADTRAFAQLPIVHAANHQPAWALNQFYRLEARFNSVDERLVALDIDSRGALDVELINGLKIKLGRSHIERKIKRLVSIYTHQILPRREQIQQLDLRYSNGFAVAWKKEVLQGRDEASIWSNSNV